MADARGSSASVAAAAVPDGTPGPLGDGGFGRGQLRAMGQRLRQLRETRGWSLKDLAARSGVSVAAIHKIEQGKANTGLMTVFALSEALGEPVDSMVRASVLEARVVKVVHAEIPARAADDLELTGLLKEPRLGGRLTVLPPGARRTLDPGAQAGPLFLFILSGRIRLDFADGETETLSPGDALHMELGATESMRWTNPFATSARFLCITDHRRPAP